MKRSAYRERDYAFGQTILTLRNAIGMTQAALADFLGVSRRAVGEWEMGGSYPKSEHLKHFIELAVKCHAFRAGGEANEIRALWHAAAQKALVDEGWLATLLSSQAQPLRIGHGERKEIHQSLDPANGPYVDWDDALSVPTFYGRAAELTLLTQWVVKERCRVVSLLGLGGIGKSALAVTLMHDAAQQFQVVIWRSLRDAPSCDHLLQECFQELVPQLLGETSLSFERRLSLVLNYLRHTRVLLVLDNLESLLEEAGGAGHMREGYADFSRFLRRLAETEHQSCLLLTSREKPIDLIAYEGNRAPVRALRLVRLESAACEQLLAEKDVTGAAADRARLIEAYTGNPLALKIVCQTIVELFDGTIAPFLEQGEIIFGEVSVLLNEQFTRLSALEQSVLLWLAILREPATLNELLAVLVKPTPHSDGIHFQAHVLEAVEALHRRSLIERGRLPGSFTLQSVVLEYVTNRLIAQVSDEIQRGSLILLLQHGLELAQVRDYVRHTQQRLIMTPVLTHLRYLYPQASILEGHLLALLNELATWSEYTQGYGPSNLVALLHLQRGHLRGIDLSRLTLRNLDLQDVDMQDVSLAHSFVHDCVFTEDFEVMTAVAISYDGKYWATATRRGEVRVWRSAGSTGGPILHRVWQAHTDLISGLDFGLGYELATTGGADSTVKLWDIDSGAMRWSGTHLKQAYRVLFSPDGRMLASCGNDGMVRVWELQSGAQIATLPHSAPVIAIAWSPAGGLLASSDEEGAIHLWALQLEVVEQVPAKYMQTFLGVDGLAFSPDGRTLASAGRDGKVMLWEVGSGLLLQTLDRHTARVTRVAWSPDGRVLASCGFDRLIWLWDVDEGNYRMGLQGHLKGVTCFAFTPDSHGLLSASEDGSLRLWDVAGGQCLRVLQGYAATIHDVDWSPDSTQVVSGGADSLVTIYAVDGSTAPRVLRGHDSEVLGVGWNPTGNLVATNEWNNLIRLWDATSGVCRQILQHPDDPTNCFDSLAWSPNGERLATATYARGVEVFESIAPPRCWNGEPLPAWMRHVVWSYDGKWLAAGGDDGAVYVWDAASGTIFRQLTGHHDRVICVAWSPDGRRLASGSRGSERGELFIWDVQRGERVATVAVHAGVVSAVAWAASPGEPVISGGDDGELRWWDLSRGECVRVCAAHQGTVQALKLSPDGKWLASCGDDGAILLWDAHTGGCLQTLRRDRPYERMKIEGLTGITTAQRAALMALGAVE